MKKLNQYISEKLIVNNTIQGYNYHPKDKDELIDCIKKKIKQEGLGTKDEPLDLNDIDTSKITDMSYLFDAKDEDLIDLSTNGYFDISEWDVTNVKNMYGMFYKSNFDGDLSKWNVSNVTNMTWVFAYCYNFNCNLSDWDVSNVKDMSFMFANCPLDKNPPKWYHE